MAAYPLVKCPVDDPECCSVCQQNNTGDFYKVVAGTERCPSHGGAPQEQAQKRASANQYRLEVWQHRLREFTEHDQVKSLRDEIGILRITLEEQLRVCANGKDLLMFSARIQSLTTDIQKLVTSCDRLERNMGQMMDKPTAIKFAGKLIEIVSRNVDDAEALERISHEVLEELR